jgi:hypothetical protein
MQRKINLLLLFCTIVLCSSQCKKTKTPLTELEKLPPITQTGANTFGCLVDGVAWLPNGSKPQNGGSNIQVYVDPTFQGGRFSIIGHQYNNFQSKVSFGSANCTTGGYFDLSLPLNGIDYNRFLNNVNTCEFSSFNSGSYRRGFFNISRYDLANGIFSGTFDFTIKSQACGDTIRITSGRFDVKL